MGSKRSLTTDRPPPAEYAGAVSDPYETMISTSGLGRMARALDVVDEHAELNHRYRRLIAESRQTLRSEQIRLTQARGVAKKLMVLVKAGGEQFRCVLEPTAQHTVDDGLAQADELVYDTA